MVEAIAWRRRERYYERHRIGWLTDLGRDFAYAAKSLRRSPGFAVAVVLTLAVGLGASTTIFSAVNAVLLRPLPYAHAEALVLVEHPPLAGTPAWARSAWRERSRSLDDLAGFETPSAATLLTPRGQTPAVSSRVTPNFFSLLGIAAVEGRVFTESDEPAGAAVPAVLTHGAWLRHFSGDPEVVGSTITHVQHGRETLAIVGVLHPDFRLPLPEVSGGMTFGADRQPDIIRLVSDDAWMKVIGRLSRGAGTAEATTELFSIFREDARAATFRGMAEEGRLTLTVTPLRERLAGSVANRLLLMMAAVGCVLLIVCANVASLMLARTSTRQVEFAVRTALGAGTDRLIRLILAEGLLLALMSGVAAFGISMASVGFVQSAFVSHVSYVDGIRTDWRVLTFGILTAATIGMLSSLAAVAAVRLNRPGTAIAGAGARQVTVRTMLARSLLAMEAAATFVLVVMAALLTQTLWNLHHVDRGFNPDGLATAVIMPTASGSFAERQEFTSGFFGDLILQVRALPGVESAAAASLVPLGSPSVGMSGVSLIGGESGQAVSASVAAVSPDYFKAIGTALLAGREFSDEDREGTEPVAIVNETMWRALATDAPRVGDWIQFGKRQLRVIGIARSVSNGSLREPADPAVYIPLAQTVGGNFVWDRLTLLARLETDGPAMFLQEIRKVVWSLGHDVVVDDLGTSDERVRAVLRAENDAARLYGLLAAVALAVSAAGAFAVVAYAVAQRRREIGIRMALGSTARRAQHLVLKQALTPTIIGTAAGVVAATGITDVLETMLFGVTPLEPAAFLAAGVVLIGGVAAAAYLPARRAARIDPVIALRTE